MIGDLANHLWQSTVFAAGIWLLTCVVRRNHARVRYWLWLAASMKFLLPFALLTGLAHQIPWAPDTQQRWSPTAMAVAQINEPFSEEIIVATPALPPAAEPARRGLAWQTVVFIVWGLGVAAIVVMRLRGWRRLCRLAGASMPADLSGVNLPEAVQVRSVSGRLEPGVIGVFTPILLLPSGIQDYLTPRQLEAVIAHELCHVRRRDNLTAAIHMLAEAVFWFHPLIWWIGSRLVESRERACDEDVLRELGDPDAYAEGILNVCKLYVRAPLVCVSGVSGADLRTRLEAIVSNRLSRRLTTAKAAALVVTGVLGISLPVGLGAVAHRQTNLRVGPDLERRVTFDASQVARPKPTIQPPVATPEAPRQMRLSVPLAAQQAGPPRFAAPPETGERLIVLFFDVATMVPDDVRRSTAAGVQFVNETMTNADSLAVVTIGTRLSIVKDFTSSREELRTALESPGLLNETAPDVGALAGNPISRTADAATPGDVRLRALTTLCQTLAPIQQRKAVVFFSSGIRTSGDGAAELRPVTNACVRANAAIYPVDARGLRAVVAR